MVVEAIDLVRRTPPGERVELELSASDLEALARAYLDRKADLDVRDVAVQIEDSAVTVRGTTSLLGRDVSLSVTGAPSARERRVHLDLRRVELNGGPAPKFAIAELSAFLTEKFNSPKMLLDITAIECANQRLRVTGYRRAAPGGPGSRPSE